MNTAVMIGIVTATEGLSASPIQPYLLVIVDYGLATCEFFLNLILKSSFYLKTIHFIEKYSILHT